LSSSAQINRAMTPAEWGLLLALSVLWGGSFFFNGVALRAFPPLTLVLLRVGLAAVILSGVMRVMGLAMPRDRGVWLAFLGMGLLNNIVPFGLIVWGQTHIASGLASILNATTPLFGVIVAHLLTTDEKMTGARLAGVLVGLAGVVAMIGWGLVLGEHLSPRHLVGMDVIEAGLATIDGRMPKFRLDRNKHFDVNNISIFKKIYEDTTVSIRDFNKFLSKKLPPISK